MAATVTVLVDNQTQDADLASEHGLSLWIEAQGTRVLFDTDALMGTVALTPQLEDYIEAIGEVCRDSGVVRVKEIASRMEVTNPSVVRALRALKREGLVEQERYGFVRLTNAGQRVARSIQLRHEVLADFLEHVLGLNAAAAAQDACRMEHAISPETLDRLRAVVAFTESGAHGGPDWRREFGRFLARRARRSAP